MVKVAGRSRVRGRPRRVALAYTVDSRWRNRSEFITGRAAIRQFLAGKWDRELDYRLVKELCGTVEERLDEINRQMSHYRTFRDSDVPLSLFTQRPRGNSSPY